MEQLDMEVITRLISSSSNQKYDYIKDSITFLQKTLDIFELDTIYISFNGGQDATIVLYLTYLAVLRKRSISEKNLNCVYFQEINPLDQVDDFITVIQAKLGFTQMKMKRNFKESMNELIKTKGVKGIIMGTRQTDPYAEHLEQISPSDSDKGYPPFLRINPIINWSYEQVWTFLRDFNLPYCSLYDLGYTYLGNKNNSFPNPYLKQHDKQNEYIPAYAADGKYELYSRSSIIEQMADMTVQDDDKEEISIFIGDFEIKKDTLNSKDLQNTIYITVDDRELKKVIITQILQSKDDAKFQICYNNEDDLTISKEISAQITDETQIQFVQI